MRLMTIAFALLWACGSTVAMAGDHTAKGKKVFNKCRSCHAVGAGAKNKIGPQLNGIVGRPWGAVEDYSKYSKGRGGTLFAITEAEPMTWGVDVLTAYLRKPKEVIPKGTMPFPGLKKDEDIENIIFYLAQFDIDGNEVDPEEVLAGLEEAAAAAQ